MAFTAYKEAYKGLPCISKALQIAGERSYLHKPIEAVHCNTLNSVSVQEPII